MYWNLELSPQKIIFSGFEPIHDLNFEKIKDFLSKLKNFKKIRNTYSIHLFLGIFACNDSGCARPKNEQIAGKCDRSIGRDFWHHIGAIASTPGRGEFGQKVCTNTNLNNYHLIFLFIYAWEIYKLTHFWVNLFIIPIHFLLPYIYPNYSDSKGKLARQVVGGGAVVKSPV
jgi:hypothetical protein